MILGKAAILAAEDRPIHEVDVPEWGGKVLVRALTAGERDRYETEATLEGLVGAVSGAGLRARLSVICLCDEDGNRIFDADDAEELAAKNGRALDRVFELAAELSGMGANDVETLAGNSDSAPKEGFSLNSPSSSDEPSAS